MLSKTNKTTMERRKPAIPHCTRSGPIGPFTPSGFAKLVARAGDEAWIGFKVHPHMLRHSCGYALATAAPE
jgi:site-specific recombinase XerD